MIERTFLDKCTTIFKGNSLNFGLHPISMLNYGNLLSRVVIYFDMSNIQEKINDKTFFNKEMLQHTLKMKNCGSINPEKTKEQLTSPELNGIKERATSFTLIAFRLPKTFDEGVGFDNSNDFWLTGKHVTSSDGCTWYNATNEEMWDEEGIYSTGELYGEYEKFKNGEDSIIICEQHFDHGNENLELNITPYINGVIDGLYENNGICIAFVPLLEETETKLSQYVGFFNNKTNTIFTPVIESRYNCNISDDRYTFSLERENKLYLYSAIDGCLENLDELPTCKIYGSLCSDEGDSVDVQQESKGIYSASLKLSSKDGYKSGAIIYDTWSNIKYNGDSIDDVENEFVILPSQRYFSIGSRVQMPKSLNPIIVGINDNEKINRGEERIVKVFYKVPYTHSDYDFTNESYYKIYVKDGEREVVIVNWDKMLKMENSFFFMIKTNEYIPTQYFIDIKAKIGDEIRIFKEQLTYKVVSDVTETKI